MFAGASAMIGCGGTTNAGSDGGTMNPDLAMAAPTCATGVICPGGTIADQTLDLFDNKTATFVVKANTDYKGTVNINSDLASLSALANKGGSAKEIVISAVPGVLTFDGTNQSQTVTLKVSTTTDAAAFNAMPIVLHVVDQAVAANKFDMTFNLTVNAVMTITYTANGATTNPKVWSTDTLTTPLLFSVRQRPVVGTTGGTTFNFTNKDTITHIIHGDAPITHQGNGGSAPNTTYTIANANDPTGANNGGYYLHNETQSAALNNLTRVIKFIP